MAGRVRVKWPGTSGGKIRSGKSLFWVMSYERLEKKCHLLIMVDDGKSMVNLWIIMVDYG